MKPLALLLLCACAAVHAQDAATPAKGLDELLKQVRESSQQSTQANRAREERFLRNKNEQAGLLQKAEADKAAAEARIARVKSRFDAGQAEIRTLKQQLAERSSDYQQVYAAVRQAAGDFRAVAGDSLVTAQAPERLTLLDALARGAELPGVPELEQLWFALQAEMTESGKVSRFPASILDEYGVRMEAEVIRVGAFTAFADDRYLALEGAQLAALPRQPGSAYAKLARNFAEGEEPYLPILIDPSRGTLLTIEGEKPSLWERIEQGGAVGYVILAIGAVGGIIALFQLLYLSRVSAGMRRQLLDVKSPRDDNPLGRVLATFKDDHSQDNDDPELLELRLSEAVLRETPRLDRAQSLLRLFAAVAPLLGLLGTVTGMIATFQAITIFGTGDPKLMAGGISQALVTTVQGLVVAIPLLFINSLLMTRSRALTQILDEQSAALLAQRLEAVRA